MPHSLDVAARGERIDVHVAKPHRLHLGAIGLLQLNCDIGLHPQYVRDFHGAAQVDDGVGMRPVEAHEMRHHPHRAEPLGDGAAHHSARRGIAVELRTQRVAGALHLLRGGVDRAALGGQRDAIWEPVEQAEADGIFKPLHPPHDGRGARAQRGRGLAEAERARDDDKHAQVVPRDAVEQPHPDGVLQICSALLRKFCHRPAYLPAILLFRQKILIRKLQACTPFRTQLAFRRSIVHRSRLAASGGSC